LSIISRRNSYAFATLPEGGPRTTAVPGENAAPGNPLEHAASKSGKTAAEAAAAREGRFTLFSCP
jgi:hypothetical protein